MDEKIHNYEKHSNTWTNGWMKEGKFVNVANPKPQLG
jgi:hypothetical protein